jgi:hypothetical protein
VATLEEIEAELRASWDREHLAVYGDFLSAAGDLRGDLIAVDLKIGEHGPTTALVSERTAILDELLGSATAAHFRQDPSNSFEYGFGDVRIDNYTGAGLDAEEALLAGQLGGYLRRVRMRGGGKHIKSGVATVASRVHPWLTSLRIYYETSSRVVMRATVQRAYPPLISADMTSRLVEHTPVLESVKVFRSPYPQPVFGLFEHPNVRELDLGLPR